MNLPAYRVNSIAPNSNSVRVDVCLPCCPPCRPPVLPPPGRNSTTSARLGAWVCLGVPGCGCHKPLMMNVSTRIIYMCCYTKAHVCMHACVAFRVVLVLLGA